MVISGAVLRLTRTNSDLALYVNGVVVTHYAPTNINYLSNPTNLFFDWNKGAASPQTSYALYSFNWSNTVPSFYKLTVMATDSYGYVASSDSLTPVTVALTNSFTAGDLLIASIDNLPGTNNALGTTNYAVIRDGFFDLLGKARDTISTNAVSYQLSLYQPSASDTPFANVTPSPRDASGFTRAGTSPITWADSICQPSPTAPTIWSSP